MKRAALLFAAALTCACTSLTPAQQARADRFECEVHALEPLVAPALDTAELLRKLYSGSASLQSVLQNVSATQAELQALHAALDACRAAAAPAAPASAPEETPS